LDSKDLPGASCAGSLPWRWWQEQVVGPKEGEETMVKVLFIKKII